MRKRPPLYRNDVEDINYLEPHECPQCGRIVTVDGIETREGKFCNDTCIETFEAQRDVKVERE